MSLLPIFRVVIGHKLKHRRISEVKYAMNVKITAENKYLQNKEGGECFVCAIYLIGYEEHLGW